MKDIVSFETAQRLKTVGFSQPGKMTQYEFYWKEILDMGVFVPVDLHMHSEETPEGMVFAPTATDILKGLSPLLGSFYLELYTQKLWVCNGQHSVDGKVKYIKRYYENPSEACALV